MQPGRTQQIAEGVHAYTQPDGGWCLNNAGVIVSGGRVAVVDTAATESRARALRAEVLRVSGAVAPQTVVNTHFHGDHTFGNFVFPEAVVVGHERARPEMEQAGKHLCGLFADVEWGEFDLVAPELTFRDRLRLHVGAITADLLHVGPAHTSNDVVVWLPGPRVLFTGDLVLSGVTPFCPMGSVAGSLAAMDRLRELDPVTVVPGHGPVGGPELFDATTDYLSWLQEIAKIGVAGGSSPLETARRVSPGRFGGLIDAERLVPNLHRAFAEERGLAAAEPLGFDRLQAGLAEMIDFHGGVPTCRA